MKKKLYKAAATIDTGDAEPTIVAEVALPDCSLLINVLEQLVNKQCMKIGYDLYLIQRNGWPLPPLGTEPHVLDSIIRMVLRHPLTTLSLVRVAAASL